MVVLLFLFLWFAIGFFGFIKTFTLDRDFTSDLLPLAMFASIIGPMNWALYLLDKYKPKNRVVVLFKKNQPKRESAQVLLNKILLQQGKISPNEFRRRTNPKLTDKAVTELWERDKK
jgi:hypothetical protein